MRLYNRYEVIATLDEALMESMNAEYLKMLAKNISKKLPTRKAEIADVIKNHLAGDGLESIWEELDELQRAAIAEVVHSDSTFFRVERFIAKYGGIPDLGKLDEDDYIDELSPLAFFFYGGVMPNDIKERLKAFVPEPEAFKISISNDIPEFCELPYEEWDPKAMTRKVEMLTVPLTVHETELTAHHELLSVLRLIDSGKVSVSTKTHRPSAATVKTISNILEGGDYYPLLPVKSKWHDENVGPIRAFAWPLIAQAGGLAQISGSKLQLTSAGRKALSQPAGKTLNKLWSKWMKTTILDELSRVESIKGQKGWAKNDLTPMSSRRKAITRTLSECPARAWISIDEFNRYLCASENELIVARDTWDLYIGHKEYGSLGYEGGEQIINDRYMLTFLLEYAATLGLIDVALIPPAGARYNYEDIWELEDQLYLSRYDGLKYFRITALGAFCLGIESKYHPTPLEKKPVLTILPNLEITAIGAKLEQRDRIALDTYAIQVSELVWRLDRARLLAEVEQGRTIKEIKEFLTARSSVQMPDTVKHLLNDVAERSTKIQDKGLARLIECDDPVLAALIANDSLTRKHCLLAGDRHLLVPSSSEAVFKRRLRELGYIVGMGGD